MRLSRIIELLGGTLVGEDRDIQGASTLEDATEADVSFLSNPKYTEQAKKTRAGAVIAKAPFSCSSSLILTDNPYLYFARVLGLLHEPAGFSPGVSPHAWVHPEAEVHPLACIRPFVCVGEGAKIGEGTTVHPGCSIGEHVRIGSHTTLYPNVTVYSGCIIGSHCIVHAGAVIGSDGFGFAWDGTRHVKVPQVGVVIIGDHVEIGSNCTIDRAALKATRIGNGVKMDNLVQVGHNVVIGDHTIIVAQTGISGSARIGSNVVLAGQCGVAGHITIGDGVVAAARTGIESDVGPGKVISGFPYMDHARWLRVQKVYKDLPELLKRVRELERRVMERAGD